MRGENPNRRVVFPQETVECWQSYNDRLTSLRASVESTSAALPDEGYDTLSTSQIQHELDRTLELSAQVA